MTLALALYYHYYYYHYYYYYYDHYHYYYVTSVVSDSVQLHRWQPTRLPHPWDSPGKNTGVSCHFLLQCMEVKSEREVAQLCPTPIDPMDCGLPGSPIHGIFQARVLEWGATALSGPGPLVIPISVAIKLFTLPTALNIYIL